MEVGMREVARNIDEIIYIVSEPLSSSPVSTPFSKRSLPFFPLSLPPFYNLIFPSSLSLFLFLAKFLFIVRFLLRFILELSCQSYTHIPTFYLSRISSSTSVYAPHPSWFLRFPSPFREEKNPPTLWRSFPSFAFSSRFFNEKKKKPYLLFIRFYYILVLHHRGSLFHLVRLLSMLGHIGSFESLLLSFPNIFVL